MTKRDATTSTGRRQTRARGRRLFAAYKRVSVVGTREDDERLRSPEFQDRLIDGCAGANGVDVRDYPAELDVSGAKKERAILDSIIAAIEAGELDGIIVAKLDRLSRLAPKDRIEVVERIEAAGGVILSASESFDASTPEGEFVRELFFSLARMEWRKYQAGWRQARTNAVAERVWTNGRIPFGYRVDSRHRLIVDRQEAAVVVELFELRAGGASWTKLLETYEARTGRRTARQTMSALTRRRTYLGELAHGDLVNVGGAPAIVDVDLFDAVQRVNEERAGDEAGLRHAGAAVSELGGIATCKACGRPVVSKSRGNSGRRRRYECSSPASHCSARGSIVADELDAFVWDALLEWAGAETLDETIELELGREKVGERVELEHRIEKAREASAAYETDVELELELGRETYAAGRTARLELIERLEAELLELGEASELETVRTTLRQAASSPILEPDDRRALIALVVDELVIRKADRGVAIAERVDLRFKVSGTVAEPPSEAEAELVEKVAA